jgi:hypothetical protein
VAQFSVGGNMLELRVWRIGGASFALALKLRTRVPWVGPERVHRFLAGFERVKTATVEVVQDGPQTSHKVDGSVNA